MASRMRSHPILATIQQYLIEEAANNPMRNNQRLEYQDWFISVVQVLVFLCGLILGWVIGSNGGMK